METDNNGYTLPQPGSDGHAYMTLAANAAKRTEEETEPGVVYHTYHDGAATAEESDPDVFYLKPDGPLPLPKYDAHGYLIPNQQTSRAVPQTSDAYHYAYKDD